jgi:hypothetical protein
MGETRKLSIRVRRKGTITGLFDRKSEYRVSSQTNINAYISINGSASNKKLNLLERSCILMFGVFGMLPHTLVL